jgi:hypothetical protein
VGALSNNVAWQPWSDTSKHRTLLALTKDPVPGIQAIGADSLGAVWA